VICGLAVARIPFRRISDLTEPAEPVLDPFNLVAVNLYRALSRRLRDGADAAAWSSGGVRENEG